MSRVTVKDFFKAADNLEETLGVYLSTNCWNNHYSVYTSDKKHGACKKELVSSTTPRGAVEQMRAIQNVLRVINERGEQ